MAASELEIEPDLNKAPPHVEGELLKQNTKAILGKKGWRKYYFIVLNDRLQYFRKREDCKSQKEPIAYIRMSQVTEITEVVFSGVPRSHHLNCGFSLVAFHPNTQQQVTLNLLAESPEGMRYWVHALRYIKAYWSKMKIRDTVISEEQERLLLERILSEEENEREDDLFGDVMLGEDLQPSAEDSVTSIMVYFADGTKAKVNLSPGDTTSDLLENDEVKENLSSSASYLWMVDHRGNDSILDAKDTPALYQTKAKKFYALDHSHRVLVVFYNRHQDFEAITVPSYATASDIINDHDLSVQLDIKGVANRALFLKTDDDEHIFTNLESPCDVLFEIDEDGVLRRQHVGILFVRNKALGGGRTTAKLTQRIKTKRHLTKTTSTESAKILEQITEEEEAQSKALDMLLMKKNPAVLGPSGSAGSSSKSRDSWSLGEDWVITDQEERERCDSNESKDSSPSNRDSRGFEDTIISQPQGERASSLKSSRPRAAAIDLSKRGRGSPKMGGDRTRLGSSPSGSPRPSPSSSPNHNRSRSKSPRRLPEVPPPSESKADDSNPFRRRGASGNLGSKRNSTASAGSPSPSRSLQGKGPTIVLSKIQSKRSVDMEDLNVVHSTTTKRTRSPTIRNVFENVTDSRSSSFGFTTGNSPSASLSVGSPSSTSTVAPYMGNGLKNTTTDASSAQSTTPVLTAPTASDERRLEEIFSRTFQQEQEEMNSKNYRPKDTLTEKVKALSEVKGADKMVTKEEEEKDSGLEPLRPMVIDFTKLQSPVPEEPVDDKAVPQRAAAGGGEGGGGESAESASLAAVRSPMPITVPSPSLLKVILLQSSEASNSVTETKPVDFISLSGVCLMNQRGIWKIQEGCNFHDPLPFDCDDHTESFPLPGGIRAIYNHTHKRWHVLRPPATPIATPSGDDAHSMVDSGSYERYTQSEEGSDGREGAEDKVFLSKKVIITEIGSSFHEIMVEFEKSRDLAEKKRIGSDMTNVAMGHMIRARFCSALAALVLDGLRPYRLEGLVSDDIWKVTTAFCNEARSNSNSSLVFPAFDRQILQPINALKTVMRDNNIRFRTFICLSMSKGLLTAWLEALPKQRNVLRKYYLPNSFLQLASESQPFAQLYHQMLLALEPMLHLPFDLSIDFESRREEEARLQVARQQQERNRVNASPIPMKRQSSSPEEGSPQMRPNVVIKTHAATGQRSGNVISAVWERSPIHGVVQTEAGISEETDTGDQPSSIKALREIESKAQQQTAQNLQPSMENTSRQFPTASTAQQVQLTQQQQKHQQQAPPTQQQGQNVRSGRGSWLKKIIDEGLQQLNVGGAITGTPRPMVQQQQQPVQPPKSNEMRVEALYNNIGEDADELTFSRGDIMVVKEQINAEWLICELDDHTGIVPANYVKSVSVS